MNSEEHSEMFMEESVVRRLDILGKEIADIQAELETRTLLHATTVNELNNGIEARMFEIHRFGGWNVASIYADRILALEREASEFKREIRFEELSYWRDISRLKEMLRRVLKECWQIHSKNEFMRKYINKLTDNGGDCY